MERLYKTFMMNNYRLLFTDVPNTEMIKYAAVLGNDTLLLAAEGKEFRMPSWGVLNKNNIKSRLFLTDVIFMKKGLHGIGFT